MKFLTTTGTGTLLTFLLDAAPSMVRADKYLDSFDPTEEGTDEFALCGAELWGCLAAPDQRARRCNRDVQLGDMEEIGSDLQKWTYENGLLKTKVTYRTSYMFWGTAASEQQLCLGPDTAEVSAEDFDDGKKDTLRLHLCPVDDDPARHMRFLLAEDVTVQNLARVITSSDSDDEDEVSSPSSSSSSSGDSRLLQENTNDSSTTTTTHLCLTIDDTVMTMSAGANIQLKECDEGTTKQQTWQSYGLRSAFFLPLQKEWGYLDTVEILYDAGTKEEDEEEAAVAVDDVDNLTVNVYNMNNGNANEPILSIDLESTTGILTLDVSELGMGGGDYSIKFSSNNDDDHDKNMATGSFSVLPQEDHIYTCGTVRDLPSSSDPLVITVTTVAVLFMIMVIFAGLKKRKRTSLTAEAAAATSSTTVDTDSDEMKKEQKDDIEGMDETGSVATAEESIEMGK